MHAPDEPDTAPRVAVEVEDRTTPFSVQIDHIGTTDIVTVRGEIDIVSALEFEEKLWTVGSTIVVDLRHLDFMDSSGLAVLLRRHAMRDGSSELRLVVKPGIIERPTTQFARQPMVQSFGLLPVGYTTPHVQCPRHHRRHRL